MPFCHNLWHDIILIRCKIQRIFMFFENFLIDNQHDKKILQNFSKNCLWIREKVVLLHPLSEGTRGQRRGEDEGASSLKV